MDIEKDELVEIYGAREHNLKNIDVQFPRNKLVVITGLSGSGKSSLAFDTIYAEGQRRYMESFSAYARQFLGTMERPDVDKIAGLSPVISIEQKTTSQNPRSTVGTITEVYDFMRLLFARTATAYSYVSGQPMVKMDEVQIQNHILDSFNACTINILAPVVKGRKGHYRELFEQLAGNGYMRVRIDGKFEELRKGLQADRYKVHDIEVVVDKLTVNELNKQRLLASLRTALKTGKGSIMVFDIGSKNTKHYSQHLMCSVSGIAYDDPQPNTFSYNSPYGACHKCNGLGTVPQIDLKLVMPDTSKSIRQGGIVPLGEFKDSWIFSQIKAIGKKHGFSLETKISDIAEEAMQTILFGSDDVITLGTDTNSDVQTYAATFEGVINFLVSHVNENTSDSLKRWVEGFMQQVVCDSCKGLRLKPEALHFKIGDKNIAQLSLMDISDLQTWFLNCQIHFDKRQWVIAQEILKEINKRIKFLTDVGLDYLTMFRSAKTLSGGESQRIRLATQIGSQLVGVMYILDEPSIGLHQRDNMRLIKSLCDLRDNGNSVIVVEHDKETIEAADYVIDIGPGAGINGGKVVAQGNPKTLKHADTLTAQYLNGVMEIGLRDVRKGNGKTLTIKGAQGNNLKHIDVNFPLGKLIVVSGVSGSGKSTLINETLYPILNQHFYKSLQKPLTYKSVTGLKHLDKVIEIDQSPIGRTPRSNPATYTGVFTDIRMLFSEMTEAKIRGYKPGWFSFNVKGGRCESCKGAGMRTIEMNFLPDVYVHCETCNGKRYNREILDVRYRGKSINDVLNMSIDQAVLFFENMPAILHKIKTIKDVGLGYITLGQQSTTLSGGEAQRVKLATELSKKDTGNTFYILDEPTTGLHFEDVRILLEVLQKLVDKGNTVLVIEHNMDVIKVADHIIDIGPEGGAKGGNIVCEGTPSQVAADKKSITGYYLKKEIQNTVAQPIQTKVLKRKAAKK
ncbi:MAG: excinuclease ABC subunit UvrA [Bacteroidia bacterium]|nr:excinuclease ABC subunit UvrA [Bacteroidia bacterium]